MKRKTLDPTRNFGSKTLSKKNSIVYKDPLKSVRTILPKATQGILSANEKMLDCSEGQPFVSSWEVSYCAAGDKDVKKSDRR